LKRASDRVDVAKEQHHDHPRAREGEGRRAHRTDASREERRSHRSYARQELRGSHRERSPLKREGHRDSRDHHRAAIEELEKEVARMRLQEDLTRMDLLDQKAEEDKRRRNFEEEMRQWQTRCEQERASTIGQMKEAIEEVLKKCCVTTKPKKK
jgi:hypothetical protein